MRLEVYCRMTTLEKFNKRFVVLDNGCWQWSHNRKDGYTMFGRNRYAHRYSFELFKGEIPKTLEIDHTCRNRKCVNPAHLELVTHAENRRRARLTQCKHGHDLAKESSKTVQGMCRQCYNAYHARYRGTHRQRARQLVRDSYWRRKRAA